MQPWVKEKGLRGIIISRHASAGTTPRARDLMFKKTDTDLPRDTSSRSDDKRAASRNTLRQVLLAIPYKRLASPRVELPAA
jgi:hypothetical protein